ncbi:MAG: PAS domain S-box protein [Chlorobiaceae bacterium]|nr:PAS domain S-box protein [Chlorobiaceae bacterium]
MEVHVSTTDEKDSSAYSILKKENAELKKELHRLSIVIEGTNAGYWDWNVQTGMVTINRAWAEIIGYTPEELGQVTMATWENLCHPEDLREATARILGHFQGNADCYEAEVRMRHKNGHWVWILDRGKLFERDSQGRPLRMAGSHQEITKRKYVEQKLQEERNLFLEGPVTVFRWRNAEGFPIDYVSPNVTSLTGYLPSDFTQGIIRYTDIIYPDDFDRVLEEMMRFSSEPSRTSFEQEYRVVCKNGTITWLYEFTTIIRDDNGNIACYESYTLDNTIRKLSEESLSYNRRFEHLISTLAKQFISASAEQIDAMIDSALQAIGMFVQADRSYIFRFYDNQRLMDNTHEWCAEGIDPQIDMLQQLPTADFPWSMKKIKTGVVIIVPRVSELPYEATPEREILEQQDIKSLILIPLVSDSVPFGYIGFDAVRTVREWPSDSASILLMAGGIIANALQRKQIKRIIQSELDLALKLSATNSFAETLQHCLQTAITISGMDCGGIYLINENENSLELYQSQCLSDECTTAHCWNEFTTAHCCFRQHDPEYQIMTSGIAIYNDQTDKISDRLKNSLQKAGVKAFAILPVINKNRTIATINVGSHLLNQVPEFERKALETVLSHIGAAIMQAKQEEQVFLGNQNLKTLFESIDDMLFILADDGTIVHANTATVKALGYSLDELRTMNVLEVHPPDLREKAKKTVEEMLAGTETICNISLLNKSGNLLPVETKITHGTWDGKSVLFGISRDISERVKAQKALVESERKFRELTEYLPFPLFETNLKGIVTYMNHSGMEFFEISPDEVQHGISAVSFFSPETLESLVANHRQEFTHGYLPKGKEYTIVLKDGRQLPSLFFNTPIENEGEIAGMRTTVVDLTELKKAEAALLENTVQKRISEEFKSIIDNIPGVVYHLSEDNIVRFLSNGTQDWSKLLLQANSVDSLDDALTFLHPDDRQPVTELINELRLNQKSTANVYRISLPENEIKWVENRSTSSFSDDGRFTGVDGILFDVTDRIRAQEEKKQIDEKLKKTQRLETIGTLAGGIAHDFNNILTPILGYSEMGMVLMQHESKAHGYFEQIMNAAERAQHLVSQILTFSRSDEIQPIVVSVCAIVKEAMKLLRATIPTTIIIDIVLEKCGNVLADPTQLHQVVMNLCTNAFQAIKEPRGRITVSIREVSPPTSLPDLTARRYMQLSVSDTGHGMDKATMERIFEPFFTTKPVNQGTGLGLSVVHGIITSINGDITVESEPGKGCTFRVYLPIIEDEVLIEQTDLAPAEKQRNTRVLFVDDELAAAEVMQVMMGHLGFNISTLNSPTEALAEFHKNPEAFDLVITDLTMPEMTGIDMARNLHELNPQLKMILITGYGKTIDNPESLNRYGFRKLLKKPVRLNTLAQAIDEVIHGDEHR